MNKYVALLRGINVGGHKKVPMSDLIETFKKQGFHNVKTLLNTGNVVFEGKKEWLDDIPFALEDTFGFKIHTIFLPFDKVMDIVKSDPFKNIKVTPKTRLYVTFLTEKPMTALKIPYSTDDGGYKIIEVSEIAIFSVLDLEKTGTIDSMKILEQEFGKNITTRNYNTIIRIVNL
jgi:uncharacterized protein (DUF1697 family)